MIKRSNKPWPPQEPVAIPEPSSASPLPYDPFLRPADGVSIEEWRLLICSVAGPFRLAQGFSRIFPVTAGGIATLATNTKSYALFVRVRGGSVAGFALSSRDSVPEAGSQVFVGQADQILLPKEQLFIRNLGVATFPFIVTEVTV